MFNALSELVIRIQYLVSIGWKFTFKEGERKFANSEIVAIKGDKIRTGYQSEGVEAFLENLVQEELDEYTAKIMKWNGVCPFCNKQPVINSYACKECDWKL